MRQCQRCDGAVSWTNDTTTLFGGVVAHLCTQCETAWNEHLSQHDSQVWQRVQELDARADYLAGQAIAGDAPSCRDWELLYQAKDALKREAFAIGQAFVSERVRVTEETL